MHLAWWVRVSILIRIHLPPPYNFYQNQSQSHSVMIKTSTRLPSCANCCLCLKVRQLLIYLFINSLYRIVSHSSRSSSPVRNDPLIYRPSTMLLHPLPWSMSASFFLPIEGMDLLLGGGKALTNPGIRISWWMSHFCC